MDCHQCCAMAIAYIPPKHTMLRGIFLNGVTAMTQYLIMCPTLTWAQRAQRALERAGISGRVVKAPQSITESGCGYAVSLYRRFDDAVEILRKAGLIKGKIFRREDNGEYTQVWGVRDDIS